MAKTKGRSKGKKQKSKRRTYFFSLKIETNFKSKDNAKVRGNLDRRLTNQDQMTL